MQKSLIAFLRLESETPFAWGHSDCSMLLANWFRHVHGVDPAPWLRGTYSTQKEKLAVLAANRGLQRLVTRIARAAGCSRTTHPVTGDFGLIAVRGQPFGAICTGRLGLGSCWVTRSERGLTFLTNPRILRAWSIHELGQDFSTGAV